MLDGVKNFFKDSASSVGDAAKEKLSNIDWENAVPEEILDKWHSFTHDILLKLILIILAIILLLTIFDVIKKLIRGLDIVALGCGFLFIGSKIPDVILIRDLIQPAYIIGGVLIAAGLLIFIFLNIRPRLRRHKDRKLAKAAAKEE